MKNIFFAVIFFIPYSLLSQGDLQLALLKYRGGGDWYANPTSLPNLVKFCNEQIGTSIIEEVTTVEPSSDQLFNFPFIHMTGHGNVIFDEKEVSNIRDYLIGGGFLHIDDNYGMDLFVRQQMKKVFPEAEFVELPIEHPIYNQFFNFPDGLPKIHEHDGKDAQGFGLYYEDRLVCFYTYECDLGDGWEDESVHQDSPETRLKAFKMGANMLTYVFSLYKPN